MHIQYVQCALHQDWTRIIQQLCNAQTRVQVSMLRALLSSANGHGQSAQSNMKVNM